MRPIPLKQRTDMEQKPFFKVCALAGHNQGECEGTLTWDHPLTFAGKQIIDPNFTVPLCAKHHNVNEHQDIKTYKKQLSTWVALNRATNEELIRYSKAVNYHREKDRLNAIYGPWSEAKAIGAYLFRPSPKNSIPSRIKPFWVPLNNDQTKKVQDCIDYYADIHDKHYTAFEMIDKMISSCHDALPNNKKQTNVYKQSQETS